MPTVFSFPLPIDVQFSLACASAREVWVGVFFNNGATSPNDPDAASDGDPGVRGPMLRNLARLIEVAPGAWHAQVLVRPGRCEYLFLVDGRWLRDPEVARKCPDGAGEFNSVRWVESVVQPG